MSYIYKYPRPLVTVDGVIFGLDEQELQVLLVLRANDPYKGYWALPGGFISDDETLEEAVEREVEEETSLAGLKFYPLQAYSALDRDPRGRNISFAYVALHLKMEDDIKCGDDAAAVAWKPLSKIPPIAFDHDVILSDALNRLRELTLTSRILLSQLPDEFPCYMLEHAVAQIFGGPVNIKRVLEHYSMIGLIKPVEDEVEFGSETTIIKLGGA